MGLHWQFGVVQNASGSPLAAEIVIDGSAPLVDLVEHAVPAGSGAFVTGISGVPIWDISVVATGGSGSNY